MIKNTIDESYYWSAFHKEKKMRSALETIKSELEKGNSIYEINKSEKQESLF